MGEIYWDNFGKIIKLNGSRRVYEIGQQSGYGPRKLEINNQNVSISAGTKQQIKKKQQYMSLNYSHGKSPNTCETHVIVKLQTHLGKL